MKIATLLLLLLLPPGFCIAQDEKIDPERPDQSDSPDLLAKNFFQAELGINKENSSGKNYDWLYPTALFKYGLKKIELRVEADFRTSYEQEVQKTRRESGLDPVGLGFKVNINKEKKFFPKTSLIAGFGIPFFSSKDFRTEHVAPTIKLVMDNSFSEHTDLSYNIGTEWDGFSHTPDWLYSASENVNFGKNWNTYIEVYGSFRKNESPRESIDAGIGYCISKNMKVDLSDGFGLSKEALKNYIAIGGSFRFKTKHK